jgi:hypothetical protein
VIPEWDDRYLEYRPNHRTGLIIRTAIFTPAAVVGLILLAVAILGLPNSIILLVLVGIGTVAVCVEAYQGLHDLFAKPVLSRGRIERKWQKSRFLFFGRVNYLLVAAREDGADPESKPKDRLLEVGPVSARELNLGDEVIVRHWPGTNTIITLEAGERWTTKD